MEPVFLCVVRSWTFGGYSREHPHPLDNQRINPVGLLHGALLSQEKFNNKAYFIDI